MTWGRLSSGRLSDTETTSPAAAMSSMVTDSLIGWLVTKLKPSR